MNVSNNILCSICGSNNFVLRYEAKYVYSYIIDSNAPGLNNDDKFFSYLYDSREQKEANQYLECLSCSAKYMIYADKLDKGVVSTSLKNIVDIKNIISDK